jgi:hypothetical protein
MAVKIQVDVFCLFLSYDTTEPDVESTKQSLMWNPQSRDKEPFESELQITLSCHQAKARIFFPNKVPKEQALDLHQ